jgi:hypothetical protein
MRMIPDQLRSKNLVPFKKRSGRYKIPGMTSENEILMDRVDADLSAEEQSYVRHYLGYADALIKSVEEHASPEPSEVSAPERPLSSEDRLKERLKQQPPADHSPADHSPANQPDAGLESGTARKDNAVRAA